MTKEKVTPKPDKDDNSEETHEVGNLLAKMGFSAKDVSQIKLGSGIIGKIAPMTTYLTLGLVSFGLLCVFKGVPWYVGAGSVILAVLVHLHGLAKMEKIAKERPDMALLEGAQLLAYREQELRFEGKNMPPRPALKPPQTDPVHSAIEATKEMPDASEATETE